MGLDPLDEPAFGGSVAKPRPRLDGFEPHNKARLSPENRERVVQALLDGYPKAAIARALSINVRTLDRLIKDDPELEAQVEAQRSFEEAELRDILMELARKGDTVAAIFLAKARHGWRDRDDAKLKVEGVMGGVLAVPGTMPLHEWEVSAAIQQAQYRERVEYEPSMAGFSARTQSLGLNDLVLEKTAPGDLPKR